MGSRASASWRTRSKPEPRRQRRKKRFRTAAVLAGCTDFFARTGSRLAAALSRQDEFSGRRLAASLCGAATFRSALLSVCVASMKGEDLDWRNRLLQLEREGIQRVGPHAALRHRRGRARRTGAASARRSTGAASPTPIRRWPSGSPPSPETMCRSSRPRPRSSCSLIQRTWRLGWWPRWNGRSARRSSASPRAARRVRRLNVWRTSSPAQRVATAVAVLGVIVLLGGSR